MTTRSNRIRSTVGETDQTRPNSAPVAGETRPRRQSARAHALTWMVELGLTADPAANELPRFLRGLRAWVGGAFE